MAIQSSCCTEAGADVLLLRTPRELGVLAAVRSPEGSVLDLSCGWPLCFSCILADTSALAPAVVIGFQVFASGSRAPGIARLSAHGLVLTELNAQGGLRIQARLEAR